MTRSVSQHFPGFEVFIRRLEDGIYGYNKNYIPQVYGFIGLERIRVAEAVLNGQAEYKLFGGYPDSFRKFLVIGEDLREEDYIVCLAARFNSSFLKLTHRDVKGAITSLGIDESQYGDMWVEEGMIYVYVSREMQQYFIENLNQINHAHVRFEAFDSFPQQHFRFRDRQCVISSYRLDRIVSACLSKARGKAQNLISAGMVNVNFICVEDCDHLCHNGDILSIRGTGRFKIGNEIATTKNDNRIIVIRQFI